MPEQPAILVTGGSGRLGHATLTALTKRWPSRRLLSVDRADPVEAIEGVRYLRGELEALDRSVVAALRGQGPLDVAWLAARISTEPAAPAEADDLVAANVLGPIEALAHIGPQIRRIVYASSVEVYGEPIAATAPFTEGQALRPTTAYGISKMLGERCVDIWCRRHEVPLIVLRFTSLYGPHEPLPKAITDFLRLAAADGEITLHGDGSSRRDYLYISDAADAVVHALGCGLTGTFNMANPERLSLHDLATIAVDICDRGRLRFSHPSAERRDRVMDVSQMETRLGIRCRVDARQGLAAVARSEGLM